MIPLVCDSAAESWPNAKARYLSPQQPSQEEDCWTSHSLSRQLDVGLLGAAKATLNAGTNIGRMVPGSSDNIRP